MAKTPLPGLIEKHGANWVIKAGPEPGEEDIRLHFDPQESTEYTVIKLDARDLPQDQGVTWINNFAIMEGKEYVATVGYWIFLHPNPDGHKKFAYCLGGGGEVKTDKQPVPANEQDGEIDKDVSHLVKVHFDTGDPGAGWT